MAFLHSLTPEQMATTPAGVPPPGVVPNLVDPPADGNILVIVGSIMMALMLLTAGLSLYTRIFIRRKTAPEDLIGAIFYFVICIIAVVKGKYGTHMYDLSVAHVSSDAFIISGYFSNWVTSIVWGFAKTTFFLMYLTMFQSIRWHRYAVYSGLFVTWGFYIAIIIATLYFTSPAPGQTWQESFTSPRYAKALTMTIPIASGSLALDLYILILPMFPIWGLQMSRKKKVGVLAIFGTGLVACVASSLSIYFKNKLDHHTDDFSYYTLPVLTMCLVEMCVGITASCMPSMALFFRTKGGSLSRLFSRIIPHSSQLGSSKRINADLSHESSDQWPLRPIPDKSQYRRVEDAPHSTATLDGEQPVRTVIRAEPRPHGLVDDGIRLQYGIDQGIQYDANAV
ncbi:hypothetical protein BGW36DRAFT_447692 [Talaromyces proteolyticus]|uniref:Rhodopsin domain-containing protein n=1 Tax=Talaromyces proteolyticus TaxID=1131652 RepID=A0AAD4KWP1_9EURO|nr:uncharacterized protein BGW36DRAFT_447692 [Talaromyces proteolyticus]KAH8700863.1 hypothetical protein BGW36DRAFT_447692 [Talaromyces proteolyticus]